VHTRVTLLEVDTLRVALDEAVESFNREVLPALREQDGYEGVLVMVNPEGPGMIVSFWSTVEAMEAAAGFASDALARFATIFRSPPGREHYELRVADGPLLSLRAER
jgi:heme-degrading monooxygenase HmoA